MSEFLLPTRDVMGLQFLIVVFLWLVAWPVTAAEPDLNQAGPVTLEADQLSVDQQSGRYRASGQVQLQQGPVQLHSDSLWWDQQSGDLEASGEVLLSAPGEQLTGSRIHYNLGSGTGLIEDAQIFISEQNLHVRGQKIERRGPFEYLVEKGTFTTCDGEVPSWKFGAGQVEVEQSGYATARNAVFYLKDIPVFYFPYLAYPVKDERKSGLLMPEVGVSDRRGFQFSGAYYFAIARNQDATFYLDYLSKLGIGQGLEYRYSFTHDNVGEARIYHINVKTEDSRFAFQWRHDGWLPNEVRMVADTEYVDDRQYFADFSDLAGEYNRASVQSVFFLSRNWDKINLVAQSKYIKDLERDDPSTLQLLPRANFDLVRQNLGESPWFYALGAEYTNFWRDQGVRGERFSLRPSLSVNLRLFRHLALTPELGYRERFYWGLDDGSKDRQQGQLDASLRLHTRLARVFPFGGGGRVRLRHSIDPELAYLYVSDEDQNQLPEFDAFDRIAGKNRLEYALVQRLTAAYLEEGEPAGIRELIYLRLSQGVDLDDAAEGDRFLPLRAELQLQPSETASLRLDTILDVERGDWRRTVLEAQLRDSRANAVRLGYHRDQSEQLEYATMRLDLAALKPVYLGYEQRYDFTEGNSLEQLVELEYRQQCWSTLVSLRERDQDHTVMISFTLLGVGSIGAGRLGGI